MLKLTVTIVHIWKRLPREGFGIVRVDLGLQFTSILIQIMSEVDPVFTTPVSTCESECLFFQ